MDSLHHAFAQGIRFDTEVQYRVGAGSGQRYGKLPVKAPKSQPNDGGRRMSLAQCVAVLCQTPFSQAYAALPSLEETDADGHHGVALDISEVSNVASVNILGRRGPACEAYQPTTGLAPVQVGNIQRYLDAVRSNLLFAKSVVLVEGDAEEILIPILFKKVLGLSLDELGVSLINIRSTGFQNIAVLFHDIQIKKRCRSITDFDAAFIDTTVQPTDLPAVAKYKADCLASQVPQGHLAYFINDPVKSLDLCAFRGRYVGGGPRNQPFHPTMMV